jgi:hypothetical protein
MKLQEREQAHFDATPAPLLRNSYHAAQLVLGIPAAYPVISGPRRGGAPPVAKLFSAVDRSQGLGRSRFVLESRITFQVIA